MINYIVCDDNEIMRENIETLINKVMMNNNIEYKIHMFSDYDKNFNKLLSQNLTNKVYILDISNGKLYRKTVYAKSYRGFFLKEDIKNNIIKEYRYSDYCETWFRTIHQIKSKFQVMRLNDNEFEICGML